MVLSNILQENNIPFPFKRICFKLSGEILMGDKQSGTDPDTITRIANEIKQVYNLGIEICIVIGGGNIFRGIQGINQGMDRIQSDKIGMIATIINALSLESYLKQIGIPAITQSAIPVESICQTYQHHQSLDYLQKGKVVIFAAGTGHPYFTTDTTAVLRASEMQCDILMKGTKVDGIYDKDPANNNDATRYNNISYDTVLQQQLNIMDMSAIALARDNNLPMLVFSLKEKDSFLKCAKGDINATLVYN